jgi:hypothetical protein
LGSTTKNLNKDENFLIEYMKPKTVADTEELTAQFKKVAIGYKYFCLSVIINTFFCYLELSLEE